jgi:hypothetical protein
LAVDENGRLRDGNSFLTAPAPRPLYLDGCRLDGCRLAAVTILGTLGANR